MKKNTLTIGIPAHNEEDNIANLLNTIMNQNISGFKLEKVIVACDGCTDNTARIVKEYMKKYKFINLVDDGKRLGKAGRLNNFYHQNKSDIFLVFDADVILANENVLSEIVKKFDNPKVGLVGGCNLPLPPKNFFERIVYTWLGIWFEMRRNINDGVSVHNHLGCISALSKELAAKINIPNNLIPDDDFVYFMSLKLGYKFRFAENAIVYYKTVNNIRDFFIQHSRLIQSKKFAIEYFGDWTKKIYDTQSSLKAKAIKKYLLKSPLFTVLALGLQIILRKGLFIPKEEYKGGFWQTANSSKKLKMI